MPSKKSSSRDKGTLVQKSGAEFAAVAQKSGAWPPSMAEMRSLKSAVGDGLPGGTRNGSVVGLGGRYTSIEVRPGWKWKDVPFTQGTDVRRFRAQAPLVRCAVCTLVRCKGKLAQTCLLIFTDGQARPPARGKHVLARRALERLAASAASHFPPCLSSPLSPSPPHTLFSSPGHTMVLPRTSSAKYLASFSITIPRCGYCKTHEAQAVIAWMCAGACFADNSACTIASIGQLKEWRSIKATAQKEEKERELLVRRAMRRSGGASDAHTS